MSGTVFAELRAATRRLIGSPGYALVAVMTLAIGIGANLTVLSAVRSLLLDPLAYADSERIVTFWSPGDWSLREFEFVSERVRGYDSFAATVSPVELTLTGAGDARLLRTAGVTSDYFDVLGAGPEHGRTFEARDGEAGAERVVVLSSSLWSELGEPEVGQSAITLSAQPYVIVGVMPSAFEDPFGRVALWHPERIDPASESYAFDHSYKLLGRLDDAASLDLAQSNAQELGTALAERFDYPPDYDKSKGASIQLLRNEIVGDLRGSLQAVWLTVGLLLLIACANVSSLQLVRALRQRRQLAIRRALGARPRRLVGHVLAESLLVGLGAGVVGLLIGAIGVRALPRFLPEQTLRLQPLDYGIDMALPAVGLALLAAALLGAIPALRATRSGVDLLGGRGASSTKRARTVERTLVASEIALGVVVVLGATLISQHVLELRRVDPGFRVDQVTSFRLQVPTAFETGEQAASFIARVESAVEALPDVHSVGSIQRLPLQEGWMMNLEVDGGFPAGATAETQETVAFRTATPGYFEVVGLTPDTGRLLEDRDDTSAPAVALVNRELARRFFGDRNPVGHRVKVPVGDWATVVGVVDNERVFGLDRPAPPILYQPYAQTAIARGLSMTLRSPLPIDILTPTIRRAITDVDPTVAPADFATMGARLDETLSRQSMLSFLLSVMALVALLLGGLGLSGLLSNTVLERRQEFGIRLALGARPRGVLGRIGGEALVLCAIGLAVGILLSWLLQPTLESWLGVLSEPDVGVVLVIAGSLCLTGLAAAVLPMLRAGRVDPVQVLERR